MKAATIIFALVFCAFAIMCTYLYFTMQSFHFALFAVICYLISYFMFKDYKAQRL
jgi:hypothetical protein